MLWQNSRVLVAEFDSLMAIIWPLSIFGINTVESADLVISDIKADKIN